MDSRSNVLLVATCLAASVVGCSDSNAEGGGGGAGATVGVGGALAGGGSDQPALSGADAGGSLSGGAAGQSGASGGTAFGGNPSGGGGSSGSSFGGAGSSGAGAAGASAGAGGQSGAANAIESIGVRADGQTSTSKTSLDNGELFLLKATGTVDVGGTALDAEYGSFNATQAGQDLVSGTDVGVDVGVKVERTPKGTTAGRKKWFGNYRTDHTYYVILTGSGAPLSLKFISPPGTATGTVNVSLFRLSPTAPALAPALETVMANVTKPTVRSLMAPSASAVYLLQVTGSGKTGGANLALGDADWMDWDANGNGKVDIGDGNVDYGLGVDESSPEKALPRRYWWGPWRKDHSYYVLYAGTGAAIGFSYYDVGDYGDNSKTDKLPVHIFPVP